MRRELAHSASTPAVADRTAGNGSNPQLLVRHAHCERVWHQCGRSLGGYTVPGSHDQPGVADRHMRRSDLDHRRMAARTEAGYWIAIVAMRAAATNVADIWSS